MAEGILDAAEEVVGGLAVDGLAVGLAGVGQHDAEDMGSAALAIGPDDGGTGAEVDLGLVTGLALEATEGKLAGRLQAADEATDAVVAAREAVFGGQILVDALGAEAQVALGLDHLPPRLALAGATVTSLTTVSAEASGGVTDSGATSIAAEPGGAMAGFGAASLAVEPEGAMAGFGTASLAVESGGALAGFDAASLAAEPGGALAGFDAASLAAEPGGALAGFDAASACLR